MKTRSDGNLSERSKNRTVVCMLPLYTSRNKNPNKKSLFALVISTTHRLCTTDSNSLDNIRLLQILLQENMHYGIEYINSVGAL